MPAVRISRFSGLIPRLSRRALGDTQAQQAVNCQLTSGDIVPLKTPLVVTAPALASTLKSMYRMVSAGVDYWLAWTKDVDVAKGPIAGDTTERVYYTGDGEPKVTNLTLATSSTPYPKQFYVWGVFPPKTVPTIALVGGVGTNETRAYVYTFVANTGLLAEESQPSAASAVTTGKIDASWNLSNLDTAPPNSGTVTAAVANTPAAGQVTLTLNNVFGLRAGEEVTFAAITGLTDANGLFTIVSVDTALNQVVIAKVTAQAYIAGGTWTRRAPHNTTGMTKRIYRTLTGTGVNTSYQLVAEIAAATTTYSDTVLAVALGSALPSLTWAMPPTTMLGVTSLPNGGMAGFSGNSLCFAEPYHPHAWPSAYQQVVPYNIVAVGVFGSSIAVLTEGSPYVATGADPSSMSMTKIDADWPCLSKRGVASFGFGVLYPTAAGLALIGVNGNELVTKEFYTQVEWSLLVPSTFIAAAHDGKYYASYTADGTTRLMFVLDRSEQAALVGTNIPVDGMYNDRRSGDLYLASSNSIKKWNAGTSNLSFSWISKEFLFSDPVNLGAAKVDAEFTQTSADVAAAIAAYNLVVAANQILITANATRGSINGASFNTFSLNGSAIATPPDLDYQQLQFTLYVDGVAKFSRAVSDNKVFRLPAGYKADTAALGLAGNLRIYSLAAAETPLQLKRT